MPTDQAAGPVSAFGAPQQALDTLAGHNNNLAQLVQLRWLAVAGQLATIFVVHFALGIALPLQPMLGLLGLLLLFNAACWWRGRWARPVGEIELMAGLLLDVAVLTGQLYFAGGVTNPFIHLYLLQVAVASVLLRPRHAWVVGGVASLCFVALTQWHRPLPLPGLRDVELSTPYLVGVLLCFLLNAVLAIVFIVRIGRNLRARDARLAALRQRAAEEEHIVRMGLLASGAAHELGTPLSTLAVILGDWARMAPFAGEPELREDIEEMQRQVLHCKQIVSGILLSAGEATGDAPVQTTLHRFLDEAVARWRATRSAAPGLNYDRQGLDDQAVISDSALRQMIDNVLDNALEAAPGAPPTLLARCEDGDLVLRVLDQGDGFAPAMLERFGKPYQSSKGRPGGGLGLFLAVNVARSLGGRIEARNRIGRGADVEIRLPLSALAPPTQDDAHDAAR